jgi:endonuclease YncB( thermonuclease family)
MMYLYNASVLKVIDGDTIDFNVDLGFKVHLKIRTRLLGVNAYEVNDTRGVAARDWVRAEFPIGKELVIETFKEPGDKYGRWLAIVPAPINDLGCVTLNDLLIAKQYGVPY